MLRLVTIMLAAFISLPTQGQTNFDALQFSNLYPQATQQLSFTFNKKRSSLIDEKNIYIEIYEFNFGKSSLY